MRNRINSLKFFGFEREKSTKSTGFSTSYPDFSDIFDPKARFCDPKNKSVIFFPHTVYSENYTFKTLFYSFQRKIFCTKSRFFYVT